MLVDLFLKNATFQGFKWKFPQNVNKFSIFLKKAIYKK